MRECESFERGSPKNVYIYIYTCIYMEFLLEAIARMHVSEPDVNVALYSQR